jgi:hypothetical protein
MNILCMFANILNLNMVFVMSNRTVPVAAARLCHSGRRCPVPVDAACCRPLSGSLLPLLVGGVVACCCPLLLADRQPKVSDRQMIILKLYMSVCARVFG